MKRLIPIILLGILSGCGMPDKLDDVRDKLTQSDQTQASILGEVTRTGNGTDNVQNLTQEVRDLTRNGMHTQTLGVALQGMFSTENTQQSSNQSPPTAMIPFAQTIALEATEDEAISLCDLLKHEALDTGNGI